MARYTKKDADGRYYIESVNGKLESDKFGHTYGEAIDRFAELENADVAREIIEDVATLIEAHWSEIQHGVYWLVCGRCTPLRELLQTVEKKYTEGK